MKGLRESLAAAGVHTLLVQFTDLHGIAKGKLVPLAHLDDVLAVGANFYGPAIAGSGLAHIGARCEYMARGVASTAQPLPWLPGVARIVAEGFVAGAPFDACPRQVLARAVRRLAERRWTLRVGVEPAFFLLRQQATGQWQPADGADRLDQPSYDLRSQARQLPFLRELQEALDRCGLDVLQIDHKDAPGQYEISFAFVDALAAADRLMLFRLAAQAIAERHGLVFSLMPKPFTQQPGSGLHCHVSLWEGQGDNARNVFTPHRGDGAIDLERTLSPLGRQFVAGVLAHAGALTALAAPTVNSYKRLTLSPTGASLPWAPTCAAQGPNNRTALVRTLGGRFEWRAPDASANPYLMLAGLIAAGLDGIDRQLDPGPDCEEDLYALSPTQVIERGLPCLPASLGAALDALADDATVCAALGETLTREFTAGKRAEQSAHDHHVSDWELQRYATAF
jgi:glutamine synthetase